MTTESEQREHVGQSATFEHGEFCFSPKCWCSDLDAGSLMVLGPRGELVPHRPSAEQIAEWEAEWEDK